MVATLSPLASPALARSADTHRLRAANDSTTVSIPRLMLKEVSPINDAVARAAQVLNEPVVLPGGVVAAVEAPSAQALAEAAPRRFRWARNVLLGAGVSFMDAGISTMRPLRFVWDHLQVVGQAIIYLALPLIPSFMLLSYVPSLAQAFSLTTPLGAIYLLGLYISSAFLLLLASFSASFCWRGGLKLMDHFAKAGEEAFPPSK